MKRYILLMWLLLSASLSAQGIPQLDIADVEASLAVVINDYRATNALPPITADARLARAAHHHASEMASLGYVDKLSPTVNERTPRMRIAHENMSDLIVDEINLAVPYYNYADAIYRATNTNTGFVYAVASNGRLVRVLPAMVVAMNILTQLLDEPSQKALVDSAYITSMGVACAMGESDGTPVVYACIDALSEHTRLTNIAVQTVRESNYMRVFIAGYVLDNLPRYLLYGDPYRDESARLPVVGGKTAYGWELPLNSGRYEYYIVSETSSGDIRDYLKTNYFIVDTGRRDAQAIFYY